MRISRARLGALALVPVFALTATACGGDDDSGEPTKVLSAAELKAALPGQGDFPDGWTVESSEMEEEERSTAKNPKCQPLLDLMAPGAAPTRPTAAVDVTATRAVTDEEVTMQAVGMWSFEGDAAAKLFSEGAKALDECGMVTSTDSEGTEETYTTVRVKADKYGDETLAFNLTQDYEGTKIEGTMVVVRVGKQQISFFATGVGTPAEKLNPALIKATVERVEKAAQG